MNAAQPEQPPAAATPPSAGEPHLDAVLQAVTWGHELDNENAKVLTAALAVRRKHIRALERRAAEAEEALRLPCYCCERECPDDGCRCAVARALAQGGPDGE